MMKFILLISLIILGSTQVILPLPLLLCLCKIHRILRILPLNAVLCVDTAVGLLPDQTIRLTCAQTAARHSGAAACALLCTAALLRLHLCSCGSAARVAGGAASPGLHIGKCSRGALLIGSDASSASPSSPASSNPAGA